MPANAGTDATQGQTPSACKSVPTVGTANAVDSDSDPNTDAQPIEYPEGQTHGVTFYAQLDDAAGLEHYSREGVAEACHAEEGADHE